MKALAPQLFFLLLMLATPQMASACIFGCLHKHCEHHQQHHTRHWHRHHRSSSAAASATTTSGTSTGTATTSSSRTSSADLTSVKNRMQKLEDSFGAFETKLGSRLDKLTDAISTLSKRQEETVGALEEKIENSDQRVGQVSLNNSRQILLLVMLRDLAPNRRVKADAKDDVRKVFDGTDEDKSKVYDLVPKQQVRRLEDKGDYVKIEFINRASLDAGAIGFVHKDALEELNK